MKFFPFISFGQLSFLVIVSKVLQLLCLMASLAVLGDQLENILKATKNRRIIR